jgi:hypothetical protein
MYFIPTMCTSVSPWGAGSIAVVGVTGASVEIVAELVEVIAIIGVVDASASVVDVAVISVRFVVVSNEEGGEDVAST